MQYVNKGVFEKHYSYTSSKYWKTIQQPFCENVDSILHLDILTYDNNHNNNNTAKTKLNGLYFIMPSYLKILKSKDNANTTWFNAGCIIKIGDSTNTVLEQTRIPKCTRSLSRERCFQEWYV